MLKSIFKWALRSTLVFMLFVVVYLVVMSARFYGFNDTPATHIPDSADILIQADSPEAVKHSSAYKLLKRLLKDKILGANLEKAFGAEFVKSIDDDTIFEQAKGFMENDIACAVKLNSPNSGGVLITQLPLRYFIFTPLAGLAMRYAGLTKYTEDGFTYFQMQQGKATLFIAIENRNALVSTSKETLLDALKSTTSKTELASQKGITAILTGDSLKYIKDAAMNFPFNELLRDIDMTTLTKAVVKTSYDGGKIPIELTLDVKCKTEKTTNPLANFQSFVPPHPLMVYLEKAPAIKSWERVKDTILPGEQSKDPTQQYLYNTFGIMIKDLVKKGIEENLLSLCGDTTAFILDSEEFDFKEPLGIWTGNFPVLGFVAPLRETEKAVDVLDEITSATLKENPGAGEMTTIEYKGQHIRVFQLGVKAVEILKVFDPCYAEIDGYLLFATSKKLILKMVEATLQKRKFDVSHLQNVDTFLQINMNGLKSAIEGPLHLGAIAEVDTDDNKRKIRSNLEAKYPNQSDADIERVDKLVIQEVESQKHDNEAKKREAFRWLLYLKDMEMDITKSPDKLYVELSVEPLLK